MVDAINDIVKQAHQGSVAAIIQILNEKLADSGVRTRAIFVDGILQLLCEAATPEQLDQRRLVNQIRQILESLQPRNIRRININSRIVREQQLLWLEEINRDPKNQLLWSELITLRGKNILQRLTEDWRASQSESHKAALPKASLSKREQRQFWRGIIGGTSLSVLLVVAGWALAARMRSDSDASSSSLPPAELTTNIAPSPTPQPDVSPQPDAFVQAVRIAEQAAIDGQNAQSSTDWLDLATRWQRASDLMAQVPPADGRYKTAQDRTITYRQNSDMALRKAESLRSPTAPGDSPPSPTVQSGSN